MGRSQARAARVDEYLSVQKHGRPDLRVVRDGDRPGFAPVTEPPKVRSLRPDWLPADLELPDERAPREPVKAPEPSPAAEPRRTVHVTGRPEDDLRFESYGKKKNGRRRSPTAARLAGRPDRVAGWAVALGVVMALMAGATAGGEQKAGGEAATPQPPALGR